MLFLQKTQKTLVYYPSAKENKTYKIPKTKHILLTWEYHFIPLKTSIVTTIEVFLSIPFPSDFHK